ncbi:aldehyde dehydrogenase family protein [Longimicrobium sp.]|uniref:aldehyde dehydrogenase family protein n=1 Tax=Longimicrobium sp. TaxID=2029185 RepID=UPI002C8619E9|nr:aldehyde dehydrogenase family protein [Longimicrobium sp.]HSU16520.1 aldehyde dehydrogenase family protein [Longimicrobium sp.]
MQTPAAAAPAAPDANEQVAAAVARARAAQAAWGALTVRQRARKMRALRGLLIRRMDHVIAVIREETGKPAVEALGHEVMIVAGLIKAYEKRAPRVLRPKRVGTGILVNKGGTKIYQPFGVVGVISPWNFPFSMPGIPTVAALFAGNAVVIKPSEVTPRTGALLAELAREAIPGHPDLVQVVHGAGDAGAALVRSGVGKIAFIGSPGTGRKILAGAAETLTPVVMELGANDVSIVCEDADLERAAAGVVWGAISNAGQVCMSVERALVPERVYDRFAAAVRREMEALRVGGGDEEYDVGRLIFPPQQAIIQGTVDDAVAQGARVVLGGRAVSGDGLVYAPTLILDATPEMALNTHETFGPVLPLVRVKDEEEAVRIANSGRYGLNASVWTRSRRKGRKMAERLHAGMVMVNDVLINFGIPELPYGGVKESGFGRMMGDEGLLEFSQVKAIADTRVALRRELFWFPYRPKQLALLKRLARTVYGTRG